MKVGNVLLATVSGFLSFINCLNVTWAARVQNVFTLTKVAALGALIVVGMAHLAAGHLQNYRDPWHGTNWSAPAISVALYQAIFTYGGWENLCFVMEELKNRNRNLPIAIILSTLSVTAIYTLANIAYLAVLTPSEMLSSDAVGITFASRAFGSFTILMPIFVIVSSFGCLNGVVFVQARVIYVSSRNGQMPEAFSLVHLEKHTPIPALVLHGVLAVVFLLAPSLIDLVNYATFTGTLTNVGCMAALFWFRWKEPDRPRPFKVWLIIPILYMLVSLFLLVLPFIQTPGHMGLSAILTFSGLPVYYISIHRHDLTKKVARPMRKLTYACQLLFLGLPGEKEE